MKNSNFFPLLLIVLAFCTPLSAQQIKRTVAIAPIGFSEHTSNEGDAIKLYNYILNALQRTQRVNVLDRLIGQKEIVKEKKMQQGMDFVEGNVVKQGKQSGADYILVTYINSINAVTLKKADTDKVIGYEGNLSVFFRVLSVETGQVIASAVVSPSGSNTLNNLAYDESKPTDKILKTLGTAMSSSASTPAEAISRSMEKLENNIREFIDDVFPLEMKIGDIQTVPEGKKKVTEVYIVGGKSTGFNQNDILTVVATRTRTIAGVEYKDDVQIGKIKVKRIGIDLVPCKIIDNEEFIMEEWKTNPDKLKVIYRKPNSLFGN